MSNTTPKEQLLRIATVLAATGLPRSSLYLAIKKGFFPKPVKLSERSVAWKRSEVDAWIESRQAA